MRQPKLWKKHIRVYVVLIDQGQSCTFKSREWGTAGPQWLRIVWSMQKGANLVATFINQPLKPLHPTVASWPFDGCGLDATGPLPKSSRGHSYILAGTDYFSKWAKVVPLATVNKQTMVNFICNNIIFRYGVPHYIISNNGKPFYN